MNVISEAAGGIRQGQINVNNLKDSVYLKALWAIRPESLCAGELDGVEYAWVNQTLTVRNSPHITHLARPGEADSATLDTLDGNVTAYDVPPEWRKEA